MVDLVEESGFTVGNKNMCVCEACRFSIRNSMKARDNGEPYQLRWLKDKRVPQCCVPSCSSVDIKAEKHEFTWEMICICVGIGSTDASPGDVSLCTQHYQQVYKVLHATSRSDACKCCGVLARNSKHKNFVSCPDPKRVESFLRDTIAFSDSIEDSNQVCYPCYKFFNQMLKSDVCMLASDDIVLELKAKKESLEKFVYEFECTMPSEASDVVDCCLYKTALHACELVASDYPFLFPTMYRLFTEYLSDYDIDCSEVCTSKSRLLTFLGNEFGELLTSFCVNRSIGTIFHRTKADMHVLLSHSLHANSRCTAASQAYHANLLNHQVHELVNHQKSESGDQSMKLAFDVDQFVATVHSIAPELWEHVCKITQSVNERKGRSASVKDNTFTGRIKQLRRAYLVSLIVFITNNECNSPFHAVLSDVIESCGGLTELITILNRFGICSSVDTLKRIIHSVSLDRKTAGTRSLLVEKAFTVASTDNVDFLQSNAAVYSGDQHRSWHATSIQLVQPMPNTVCHSEHSTVARRLFSTAGEPITTTTSAIIASQHPAQPRIVETTPAKKLHSLLIRKRTERSGPIVSPLRSTRSPHTKRARTFSEAAKHHSEDVSDMEVGSIRQPMPSNASSAPSTIQLESFLVTASEQSAVDNLNETLFNYVLMKEASAPDKQLVDVKTFCGMALSNIPKVQSSNVVYLPVVDLHADSTEAMQAVVAKLHTEYRIGESADYLVLVGDQKTYTRIHELKQEYDSELDWVIPFIGDWHLLSNYQSVLMKVYYNAGIKDLAESSGHRGETLTSIKKCSSYKRTHQFLLQAWEAVYRQMFKAYKCARDSGSDDERCSIADIMSAAKANMLECSKKMSKSESSDPLKEYLERTRGVHFEVYMQFTEWVSALTKDPNWKFWANFVFRDMLSYLSLFISMRSGMWKLRLSAIKSMAPLFVAFDRPHYQKLIPNHLRDLAKIPRDVLKFLESGAFVCSITGKHMRSVALDEAHEMLVNKDLKTTIVHPSKEYLDRMLYYYPVRSLLLNAVRNSVLSDIDDTKGDKICVFDAGQQSVKREENVKCMMTKVQSTSTLDIFDEMRPLTSMSGQVTTPEQQIDLLGFWEAGHERFENHVKFYVLKDPSAVVPKRKFKLLTFASSKVLKKKVKQLDREKKLVGKCLRRAFAWNAKFGSDSQHIGQQYIELPRAISDPYGNLHKGQKSYTTKWLENRYEDLICNQLPGGWVPDVVVLEGMFMINTSPLITHSTMKDYSQFLLRRFVFHHLTNGCSEIHVVFDNPG